MVVFSKGQDWTKKVILDRFGCAYIYVNLCTYKWSGDILLGSVVRRLSVIPNGVCQDLLQAEFNYRGQENREGKGNSEQTGRFLSYRERSFMEKQVFQMKLYLPSINILHTHKTFLILMKKI